jgi:hypothetical protein
MHACGVLLCQMSRCLQRWIIGELMRNWGCPRS